MKKLHLVMPMGGGGTRFLDNGFETPKPLIEIHGKPFFFWATSSILRSARYFNADNAVDITFVVLQQHVDKFNIDREIHKIFSGAKIKIIPEVLPGAVCTCLNGVEDIDDDIPVIFNDCDHMFTCKSLMERVFAFEPIDFDGALVTFESAAPQFSYVKFDDNGNIVGTVEKQVVSNRAVCGAYFFANADIFRQMSEKYFVTCNYKEFFVSGVYNELCNGGKRVVNFPTDFCLSFGTPTEYEAAKTSKHFEEILDYGR